MKLSSDQFVKQLNAKSLLSCYWFTGDETWQLEESRRQLLQVAKQAGFVEHQKLALQNLDPSVVKAELYSGSLFSNQRIIEINLHQGKLNENLSELLQFFCQKPNSEILLLLTSPKLEGSTAQSKAYKAFDAIGMVVQVWPMTADQLPKWLATQLAKHQLKTSLNGLQLLMELTEGNLLHAAQSIEKLALIYANQAEVLSTEQIMTVVAPQAHFEVFQLNEAFLQGDKLRALKICRNLQAAGEEVILVLGALLKDIRLLLKLAAAGEKNFMSACQKFGVWEKKKPLYRMALQRGIGKQDLLQATAKIDQYAKNPRLGNPWRALEQFLLSFS